MYCLFIPSVKADGFFLLELILWQIMEKNIIKMKWVAKNLNSYFIYMRGDKNEKKIVNVLLLYPIQHNFIMDLG
jgi:hypothetical protein